MYLGRKIFVDAVGFSNVAHKKCSLVNLLGSFLILNDITFLRCGFCFSTSCTICLWMCETVHFVFNLICNLSFTVFNTSCFSLSHFCTNSTVFLLLSTLLSNSLTHTAAILRWWELSFWEPDRWISFSTSRGITLFWWRKFNMAFHRFRNFTGRLLYVHLEASTEKICLFNSVFRHRMLNVTTTDILKWTWWLERDVKSLNFSVAVPTDDEKNIPITCWCFCHNYNKLKKMFTETQISK